MEEVRLDFDLTEVVDLGAGPQKGPQAFKTLSLSSAQCYPHGGQWGRGKAESNPRSHEIMSVRSNRCTWVF